MTQIREVEGKSLREALERARQSFGLGAVVIDQRRGKGGVRLAVSPDVPRSLQALEELRGEARALFDPLAAAAPAPAERREGASAPGPEVQRAAALEATPRTRGRDPGADVERRLVATGVTTELAARIVDAVRSEAQVGTSVHPLDRAAQEIGRLFPVAQARRPKGTAVLALVGRSGEGKTTTALALATLFVRAGRRVQFARLRGPLVHEDAEVQRQIEGLGLRCIEVRDAAELAAGIALEAPEILILDTSGRPERDVDQVRRLAERLAQVAPEARIDSHVVLAATRSRVSQEEVLASFAGLEPDGVVLTKLDETRVPAPALETVRDAGVPISFLCAGPDPARDLRRAGPEPFADLLLRGRLA